MPIVNSSAYKLEVAKDFALGENSTIFSAPRGIIHPTEFDVPSGTGLTHTLQSFTDAIMELKSQEWYIVLQDTIDAMNEALANGNISQEQMDKWNSMADHLPPIEHACRILVDQFAEQTRPRMDPLIPDDQAISVTRYLIDWASKMMAGGGEPPGWVANPGKYGELFTQASIYVGTVNQYISELCAAEKRNITYSDANQMVTHDVNYISDNLKAFGQDLQRTGDLIRFEALQDWGSPGEFIKNLYLLDHMGPVEDIVNDLELDYDTLVSLAAPVVYDPASYLDYREEVLEKLNEGSNTTLTESDIREKLQVNPTSGVFDEETICSIFKSGLTTVTNSTSTDEIPGNKLTIPFSYSGLSIDEFANKGAGLPLRLQRKIYDEITKLSPRDVGKIKNLLGIQTETVNTGEDFFSPLALFPCSSDSITVPKLVNGKIVPVPLYNGSSLASDLPKLNDKYASVIGEEKALAHAALAKSLLQVKGASQTNARDFGRRMTKLEKVDDLEMIMAKPTYVSQELWDFWHNEFMIDPLTGVLLYTSDASLVQIPLPGTPCGYPNSTINSLNVTPGDCNNVNLVIADVLGSPSGYNTAIPLQNIVDSMAQKDLESFYYYEEREIMVQAEGPQFDEFGDPILDGEGAPVIGPLFIEDGFGEPIGYVMTGTGQMEIDPEGPLGIYPLIQVLISGNGALDNSTDTWGQPILPTPDPVPTGFTIPPSPYHQAGGTYPTFEAAFTAAIDELIRKVSEITDVHVESNWLRICRQLNREYMHWKKILESGEYPGIHGASTMDALRFTDWIAGIAWMVNQGEEAYTLERMTNIGSLAGQHFVAYLRDMRNIWELEHIGLS